MNLNERINVFSKLGKFLERDVYKEFSENLLLAEVKNQWFTTNNIQSVFKYWSENLEKNVLKSWLKPYKLKKLSPKKNILVITAGNIPLVGFHDFLTVLVLGHNLFIKMSSSDNILFKVIISKIINLCPEFKNRIEIVDNIKKKTFSAVIATGTDNSAKYFDYYFSNSKRIIRRNRSSVAILNGNESDTDLQALAYDVFSFFGLGCRNISKIFLPKGYNLDKLFRAFYKFHNIIEHKKYANNYEYYKSIFLLGGHKIIENGFLLMKEDVSIHSPVSVLFYEFYEDINSVYKFISNNNDHIQCVVSKNDILFGSTQSPNLWDYADNLDTVDFLKNL